MPAGGRATDWKVTDASILSTRSECVGTEQHAPTCSSTSFVPIPIYPTVTINNKSCCAAAGAATKVRLYTSNKQVILFIYSLYN